MYKGFLLEFLQLLIFLIKHSADVYKSSYLISVFDFGCHWNQSRKVQKLEEEKNKQKQI